MFPRIHQSTWLRMSCFLLASPALGSAPAAVPRADFEPVHWAYSAFLGTGWYDAKDNRTIYVLRIPPSQTLRDSSLSTSGKREIGVQLRYPVTVGVHSIDDFPGLIDPDNFASASFTPGIELEIPVFNNWHLRPYLNLGWGKELDSGNSAWIYYGGVKSQYVIPGSRDNWSLIGSFAFAGYNPDTGASDKISSVLLGTEIRQSLQDARLFGEPVDLHWHLSYAYLTQRIKFELPDDGFEPLRDQVNVGLGFSFRNRPFEFWGFEIDRLGIDYGFDTDGEFKAITLHLSSWFNR